MTYRAIDVHPDSRETRWVLRGPDSSDGAEVRILIWRADQGSARVEFVDPPLSGVPFDIAATWLHEVPAEPGPVDLQPGDLLFRPMDPDGPFVWLGECDDHDECAGWHVWHPDGWPDTVEETFLRSVERVQRGGMVRRSDQKCEGCKGWGLHGADLADSNPRPCADCDGTGVTAGHDWRCTHGHECGEVDHNAEQTATWTLTTCVRHGRQGDSFCRECRGERVDGVHPDDCDCWDDREEADDD